MSLCSISIAMKRIKEASPESPLIVFGVNRSPFDHQVYREIVVDVMFASTIKSQEAIIAEDPNIIGVFHSRMNHDRVSYKLERLGRKYNRKLC